MFFCSLLLFWKTSSECLCFRCACLAQSAGTYASKVNIDFSTKIKMAWCLFKQDAKLGNGRKIKHREYLRS